MAMKDFKPSSPGRRFARLVDTTKVITKSTPEKNLTAPLSKSAGRNQSGHITVRHRGGGHKRRYRVIDFRRNKTGVPAKIAAIEYDPNRTAFIALLHYADGEKSYILAPQRINVGDEVISSAHADIKPGNSLEVHSDRNGNSQHRASSWKGRTDGTFGRKLGTADGKRRQVRIASYAFRRATSCTFDVSRNGRFCIKS